MKEVRRMIMYKAKGKRLLSLLLALMLMLSLVPTTAFAEGEETTEEPVETVSVETSEPEAEVEEEEAAEPESEAEETEAAEPADAEEEATAPADTEEPEEEEETGITDYAIFLADLKVLERYAASYASTTKENATALVINYIRTGVERYTSGTWTTMAGGENTSFTAYVAAQDAANGTTAADLKDLGDITLPNGNVVDLGHMFGTLDITYYATVQGSASNVIQARADLGGWAGDTADMMYCAVNVDIADKVDISETDVDTLTNAIRSRYLGADYATLNKVDHSFTSTDLFGDLDAYYIANELRNGAESVSALLESYFTASLNNKDRAAYFLENRLGGYQTKAGIRSALLSAYTGNELMTVLEASYSLTDLENYTTLQKACIYAFADYLFELAGDDSGKDPVTPDPDPDPEPEKPDNDYYTVFSSTASTLAPGIEQDITYAMTADNKQIVFYTATIDISRDDVSVYANYGKNSASSWTMTRVTDQMAAAEAKHSDPQDTENYIENYNTVVGVNADFYNMATGAPAGALVMEGVEYSGAGNENFFAILKDGTAMIGSASDYAAYKNQIQEAVGGALYLVKDGKIAVSASDNYYNSRASRTCVGITAEGKVVLMVLDGRQEPFSAGGSAQEIAQIMLEAGCVVAINLDGGGSTTFAAKQEGADEVTVVNRPSDGYERSVSSSLMVVSTAAKTNEFDHAVISTDTDYLTVDSSLALTVSGVSASGNSAQLPEGLTWVLTDGGIGEVIEGVFYAYDLGTTTLQLVDAEGNVVGSKTLNIVVPDALVFTRTNLDVVYGEATELPLTATYKGNVVTINPDDIVFALSNDGAGTIDGFDFTASEGSGLRNVTVTAKLWEDTSVTASIKLALYSADEARFDFDTAMYGNRKLAYNREVSNSTELIVAEDDTISSIYYAKDANEAMVTEYTFALDMQEVEVPESLMNLLPMIPGGERAGVTAWDILLNLAERVSAKTTVQVQIQFDKNLDVDYSKLKVVNDYFAFSDATLDPDTNILTVNINWIKQSEAIDSETANPIVIVSGISLTPKDNAAWTTWSQLTVTNSGTISYDIYLGANALYDAANQTSFQENYNIYPYTEPENVSHPAGGHFANTFRSFTDTYTLDKAVRNGWTKLDGKIYYFKDNQILTGVQKLPGYRDEDNQYYYDLGSDGVYTGKLTGFFEKDGTTYYARLGILASGWLSIVAEDGESYFYYFDPQNGAMYTGVRTVKGLTYTFNEKGQLIRGAFNTTSAGTKYFVAGESYFRRFVTLEEGTYWLDVNGYVAYGNAHTVTDNVKDVTWYHFDEKTGLLTGLATGILDYQGEKYYADENGKVFYGAIGVEGGVIFTATRGRMYVNQACYIDSTTGQKNCQLENGWYWCDENGYLVKNGFAEINGSTYYFINYAHAKGLIQDGSDYYLFNSGNGKMVQNTTAWVGANDLSVVPGLYQFDAEGRMVIEKYTVTQGTVTGGKLTVASAFPFGSTVTLTAEADANRQLRTPPTVTTESGTSLTVTKTGDNTYTFTMPKENVTVSAEFPYIFDDVQDPTKYYFIPVYWALDKGITSGTGNNLFSPNMECTRAQFVTFLWNAAGQPEPAYTSGNFDDVSTSAWYYKAVQWAVENGVTAGTGNNQFSPDKICSRAEFVTFLHNYEKKPAATAEVTFTDVNTGDWFYAPVQWAVENKVTVGIGGGLFGSSKACTRAEAVTFLHNDMA